MTTRTILGLCALAALTGGLVGLTLTAAPPNASATTPSHSYGATGPDPPFASCAVTIQNAHVEGSNICSSHSRAIVTKTALVDGDGRDGGEDEPPTCPGALSESGEPATLALHEDRGCPYDGDHHTTNSNNTNSNNTNSNNTNSTPSNDCNASGYVVVQTCHIDQALLNLGNGALENVTEEIRVLQDVTDLVNGTDIPSVPTVHEATEVLGGLIARVLD